MRLATLILNGQPRPAIVDPVGDQAWRVNKPDGQVAECMLDLIRACAEHGQPPTRTGPAITLSGLQVIAPIPHPPRNLFCVGKNYRAHAQEFSRSGFDSSAAAGADAVPQAPIVFTKTPETVIGPGVDIPYPTGLGDAIDYEAELAVVIGRGGRGIRAARAMEHVFGYTIVNDVTARDLQSKHRQWFLGKSIDGFCPMGPWVVTADEVDGSDLDLRCWVNGELRQQASTADLIFNIATLIETISAGITLLPGDVIATGTPEGVGIGFTPPRFLKRGDVVAIEISGLGRLENRLA